MNGHSRLQLVEFKVVDIVCEVVLQKKGRKLQMIVAFVQDLLLQELLFEFLVRLFGRRLQHTVARSRSKGKLSVGLKDLLGTVKLV